MFPANACFYKKRKVPWRVIEEEIVIVDVDHGSVLELNQVGARIWEQINGERNITQITQEVINEFEVDTIKAQADITKFIEELFKKGLVAY